MNTQHHINHQNHHNHQQNKNNNLNSLLLQSLSKNNNNNIANITHQNNHMELLNIPSKSTSFHKRNKSMSQRYGIFNNSNLNTNITGGGGNAISNSNQNQKSLSINNYSNRNYNSFGNRKSLHKMIIPSSSSKNNKSPHNIKDFFTQIEKQKQKILKKAKYFYHKQQNMQKAVKFFEQYLNYQAKNQEILYLSAIAYLHLESPQKAIDKLLRIKRLYLVDHSVGNNNGNNIGPANYNSSANFSNFAMGANTGAGIGVGSSYSNFKTGRTKKSQNHFNNLNTSKSQRKKTMDPNSMLLLALAYSKINKIDRCLQTINQCIKTHADFIQGYCFRGKLYIKMGNLTAAQNDFKKLLEISDSLSEISQISINNKNKACLGFVGLGDCLRLSDKPKQALKLYQKALKKLSISIELKNSQQSSSQPSQENTDFYEILLKHSICLYQLNKFQDSINELNSIIRHSPIPSSQAYYFLGQCQLKLKILDKALLSLQSAIRAQSNPNIMKRALKSLLKYYILNNQFYEALNIVSMGKLYKIDGQNLEKLVQGCLQIMKKKYSSGLIILLQLKQQIKQSSNISNNFQIGNINKGEGGRDINNNTNGVHNIGKNMHLNLNNNKKDKFIKNKKKKMGNTARYMNINLISPKNNNEINMNNNINNASQKRYFQFPTSQSKQKSNNSTINNNLNSNPNSNNKIINTYEQQKQQQNQFIIPYLLQFSAYAFFMKQDFTTCLQTYQQYQNYCKNVLGKQQSQQQQQQKQNNNQYNFFQCIQYNKQICQGILMFQSQMYQQALEKFNQAQQCYLKLHNKFVIIPLLYRIITLIQLGYSDCPVYGDMLSKNQIFIYTIQIINMTNQHLSGGINKFNTIAAYNHKEKQENYLLYYFKGLIEAGMGQYQTSRNSIHKALNICDDCTWKILYAKGVTQLQVGDYETAIKEFTAGLVLLECAELFLGRCIAFLMAYSQKTAGSQNQNQSQNQYIQHSFQDLQKYIQLQTSQQNISTWVSKVLFYNKAFEQAKKSLQKVQSTDKDIIQMEQCLNIYQGDFSEGGKQGQTIIQAFLGTLDDSIYNSSSTTTIQNSLENKEKSECLGYLYPKYLRWLKILNLYSKQAYTQLIKLLQKAIFQVSDNNQQLQIRYNIAIIYFLIGQNLKAQKVLNCLSGFNQDIIPRVKKMISYDFQNDQCIEDLSSQFGCRRLSSFLPYRQAIIKIPKEIQQRNKQQKKSLKNSEKNSQSLSSLPEKTVRIFLKISVPFPQFPKPQIILSLPQNFIINQAKPNIIQKKIQAPWIKQTATGPQFTNMIDQNDIDILDDDTKQLKSIQKNSSFIFSDDNYDDHNNEDQEENLSTGRR